MRRRHKNTPKPTGMLSRGTAGTLKGSAQKQWPVRVADRDDDTIMLVLLVEAADLSEEQGGPLLLECTSEHGVARFQGEAVLEERDLVRFRVAGAPDVAQRRQFVRVRTAQRVVIAQEGAIGSAHALDISGGGMLLNGPDTLALEDNIRFRLHLDDDAPPIKGRGRVVRNAGDTQRAIVFEQISKEDRERLIHFIFARQREERARTRGDGR